MSKGSPGPGWGELCRDSGCQKHCFSPRWQWLMGPQLGPPPKHPKSITESTGLSWAPQGTHPDPPSRSLRSTKAELPPAPQTQHQTQTFKVGGAGCPHSEPQPPLLEPGPAPPCPSPPRRASGGRHPVWTVGSRAGPQPTWQHQGPEQVPGPHPTCSPATWQAPEVKGTRRLRLPSREVTVGGDQGPGCQPPSGHQAWGGRLQLRARRVLAGGSLPAIPSSSFRKGLLAGSDRGASVCRPTTPITDCPLGLNPKWGRSSSWPGSGGRAGLHNGPPVSNDLLSPLCQNPQCLGAGCFPADLLMGGQGGDAVAEEGGALGVEPGHRPVGLSPLGRRGLGEAPAQLRPPHSESVIGPPTLTHGATKTPEGPWTPTHLLGADWGELGSLPAPGPNTHWSSPHTKPEWKQRGSPELETRVKRAPPHFSPPSPQARLAALRTGPEAHTSDNLRCPTPDSRGS